MLSQEKCINNSSIEINFLSSDSSEAKSCVKPLFEKRKPPPLKKKNPNLPHSNPSKPFSEVDSQNFWGKEEKRKYESLKRRPVVAGRIVNLEQLEDSHCHVSSFLEPKGYHPFLDYAV